MSLIDALIIRISDCVPLLHVRKTLIVSNRIYVFVGGTMQFTISVAVFFAFVTSLFSTISGCYNTTLTSGENFLICYNTELSEIQNGSFKGALLPQEYSVL